MQSGKYWELLDEATKNIDPQEAQSINANGAVKEARANMMSAFVDYFLFAKYREEFAALPAFRTFCDKYISALDTAKKERSQHITDLEKENEKLREELEGLRKWTQNK